MNRNFYIGAVAVIAVFVTVFFAFRHPGEVRNYPPKDGPIVAFGDSLVVGSGATDGNDFVSILSRKINEPIINMGVSGDTTEDGLARIDAALALKPRIVMVLLGGNDYIRQVPAKTTFPNLKLIVQKFQDSGAIVILLGVTRGLLFDSAPADFTDITKATGAAYVPDVLDGLFGDPKYMADQVHPNDAGNLIIANKIYPVLKGVLR